MEPIEVDQLSKAISLIAEEKGLEPEVVHSVVEEAILAAYRKDIGDKDVEMTAHFDANKNDITITVEKEVVDQVAIPEVEINLSDAKDIDPEVVVGGFVNVKVKPQTFGRVASQTAKQVILQKLREIEREATLSEYSDKVGTMLTGVVQKVDRTVMYVDLGKTVGILPGREQIRGEFNSVGSRIKVYLLDVEREGRAPQLILSRACPEFVTELFEAEVPEIGNGSVEIKDIAREAGGRTKIAVESHVTGVDAVGTFVGSHGIRVQAVQSEIGDREKIDIIQWSEDPKQYITNAMSPTEIIKVEVDESAKTAVVHVDESQVSVAIGKSGQNIRLASKLTGYEIDVQQTDAPVIADEESPETAESADAAAPEVAPAPVPKKKIESKAAIEESLLGAIEAGETEEDSKASAESGGSDDNGEPQAEKQA